MGAENINIDKISKTYKNKTKDYFFGEVKNKQKSYEKGNDYHDELRLGGRDVVNNVRNKLSKYLNGTLQKYANKTDKIYQKYCSEYRNRLNKCKTDIDKYTKNLKYKDRQFHYKENLDHVAGLINGMENDLLEIIDYMYKFVTEGAKVEANEKEQNKIYTKVDQKGIYTLTADTNPAKIHEVFEGVIKPGQQWFINYDNCKNAAIKNKMQKAIGGVGCYLQYDINTKTYIISGLVTGADGKPIKDPQTGFYKSSPLSQRALIWEGVTLTPASKVNYDAIKEKNKLLTDAAKKGPTNTEKESLKKDMPKGLKGALEKGQVWNEFFKVTEKAAADAVIKGKKLGYELRGEPVTKKTPTKKTQILEIHFIDKNAEEDQVLINDANMSDTLFDILDGNETDLVAYMTGRVKIKWNAFDHLTQTDSVISNENHTGEVLSDRQKTDLMYGLGLLGNLVDELAENEGNSRDDDDREFAAMKKYIRDAKNDLGNLDKIRKGDVEGIIKGLQSKLWNFYKNNYRGNNFIYKNITENGVKNALQKILLGNNRGEVIEGIRTLGAARTILDNEQTTFLRDEVVNEIGADITIEDTNINGFFQNIDKLFDIPEPKKDSDVAIPEDKKNLIDTLYRYCDNDNSLINFLRSKKILPEDIPLKSVKEEITNLRQNLLQQKKSAESLKTQITGESVRKQFEMNKLELESRNNLTPEELNELNAIKFTLDNMTEAEFNEIAKDQINQQCDMIKYIGVNNAIKSAVTPILAREGGGILIGGTKTNIAKIYNDSVGVGAFDLTDENCAKMGPMIVDIVVEVIVTAVSILLSWNGAGEAIYASFRAAKLAAKAAKTVMQKIIQFIKVFVKNLAKNMAKQFTSKFSVKAAKSSNAISSASKLVKGTETLGSFVGNATMKGTSLIVEGTTFHINSTIIHNAINGNNLGDGLNPFGYTEGPDGKKIPNWRSYAESIAFLGVLKGLGKTIQTLNGNMIGKIVKDPLNPGKAAKILQNSLSLVGEMGSMMGTDQILSIAFDQKFKSVTGEELISMFGMIVGLRINGKVQLKIKEYTGSKLHLQSTDLDGNVFQIHCDKEGNVLRVEGKDKDGNTIKNPEKVSGIKAGEQGGNIRDIPGLKSQIEGNKKQLDELQSGDEITVQHGDKKIKFKKAEDGKREISDNGGISNEFFAKGEKFVVAKNSDGSGFHLESEAGGRAKVSLGGKVDVNLQNRFAEYMGNDTSKEIPDNEIKKTAENNTNQEEKEKLEDDIEKLGNKIKYAEGELENAGDSQLNHSEIMNDIAKWKKELTNKEKPLKEFVNNKKSGDNTNQQTNLEQKNDVQQQDKQKSLGQEDLAQKIKELESQKSEAKEKLTKKEEEIKGKEKSLQELKDKKSKSDETIKDLKNNQENLNNKKNQLLRDRERNRRTGNGIEKFSQILSKGDKITIDKIKYQFNGIKNGVAEFTIEPSAKKSANMGGKYPQEKIYVSDIAEFAKSKFNLEPGTKKTNSGRYQKLNQILDKENVEPLDRLNHKIKNKQSEIDELTAEIARLEKGENKKAFNDYFQQNKGKLKGESVRIEGKEYKFTDIEDNGALHLKEKDGNNHRSITSFEQLQKLNAVGLKDGTAKITEKEREYNNNLRKLIEGEKQFLSQQNLSETIKSKKELLSKAENEISGLKSKLSASEARQKQIQERHNKRVEIEKQIRSVDQELKTTENKLDNESKHNKNLENNIKTETNNLESMKSEAESLQKDINLIDQNVQQLKTQKKVESTTTEKELGKTEKSEKIEVDQEKNEDAKPEDNGQKDLESQGEQSVNEKASSEDIITNENNSQEDMGSIAGTKSNLKKIGTGKSIFVTRGGETIEFEKMKNGNFKVKGKNNSGEWYVEGEEFKIQKNKDGTFHLENVGNNKVKMPLDDVKLKKEKVDVTETIDNKTTTADKQEKITQVYAENSKLYEQLKTAKKQKKGKITIDGQEIEVKDFIKETKTKIKENKKIISKLTDEGNLLYTINLGEKGVVFVESDGTMKKVGKDGIEYRGDFDANFNLVSGMKSYPNGTKEFGFFDQSGKLTNGMSQRQEGPGYKQTYIFDNGDAVILLDGKGLFNRATTTDGKELSESDAKKIKDRFDKLQEQIQQKINDKKASNKEKAEQKNLEKSQKKENKEKKRTIDHTIKTVVQQAKKMKENYPKEFDLGDGKKIILSKNKNGNFEEIERIWDGNIEHTFIEFKKGEEIKGKDLKNYLKDKILGSTSKYELTNNSRPKVENNKQKDYYSKENLNLYKEGDVIELHYRDGKGPIKELWMKGKDGYEKIEEKDGKLERTGETKTEQKMIEQMRSVRSVSKYEDIEARDVSKNDEKLKGQEEVRKQQEKARRQEEVRKQQEGTKRKAEEVKRQQKQREFIPNRNTSKREMYEIQRESKVFAIGDLHGEYNALKGNLEYAGVVKEVNGKLERTGGNSKVVFQGDILADRGTDGLKIINEIHQLREQARKQGGDINIIVGNHDDFMISYLTRRNGTVHRNGLGIASYNNQGKGLSELLKFVGKESQIGDIENLRGIESTEILNAMRKSPEGRLILEEICNMKLVSQINDILYCHTNPTDGMLHYLTQGKGTIQGRIDDLNNNYQKYLRQYLIEGKTLSSSELKEFNYISDLFLNTNNRNTSINEQFYTKLKNQGINMISHGHSGGKGNSFLNPNFYYGRDGLGGVKVIDTDFSYGKGGRSGGTHSVITIDKTGKVSSEVRDYGHFIIGQEVLIPRSDGSTSKAEIISYESSTKEYTVNRIENGNIYQKRIKESDLMNLNKVIEGKIIEEGETIRKKEIGVEKM